MSVSSAVARRIDRSIDLTVNMAGRQMPGGEVAGYLAASDTTPDEGDTITIGFTQTSVGGSYTYQFYINGDALDDMDIHIEGATTDELTIEDVQPEHNNGAFTLRIEDTVTGAVRIFGPVVITVTPAPEPEGIGGMAIGSTFVIS